MITAPSLRRSGPPRLNASAATAGDPEGRGSSADRERRRTPERGSCRRVPTPCRTPGWAASRSRRGVQHRCLSDPTPRRHWQPLSHTRCPGGRGERVAERCTQVVFPPTTEPHKLACPLVATLPVRVPVLALVGDPEPGDPFAVSFVAVHEQPDGGGRIGHVGEGEGADPQPSRRQHVSSIRPEPGCQRSPLRRQAQRRARDRRRALIDMSGDGVANHRVRAPH
jgi:hypothetical protein